MTGTQRALLKGVLAVLLPIRTFSAVSDEKTVSAADCTFQTAPEGVLSRQSRIRGEVYERTMRVKPGGGRSAEGALRVPIPQRNLIDVEVLGKLAQLGVAPARLSGDEEFYRRINLDLAGRLPSAEAVRAFLEDASPNKRDLVIERLVNSPEFVDRWTMWLGDLVQNAATGQSFSRQIPGRNAYYAWIRNSIASNKSLHDIAWEAIAFSGNDYSADFGMVNFAAAALTPMGPAQDTYDTMLVRSATAFLGMAHYDCLLCHNGRGHLDQISLWASGTTRAQAEKMAAFFSRMRVARDPAPQGEPLYRSYNVTDAATGSYALNTNFGNRPTRAPYGTDRALTPQYRDGSLPTDGNWRTAFADFLTRDRMFSRNMANRIWKYFFGLGLVDPVDTLDPARLDPSNPPPEPWSFQATHPVLLEQLAVELERNWYDLRGLIRLIVQSSAYQLSSRYEGEWKLDYVPLFARHYPRRLEGEEIHDAIAQATGVPGRYTVQGWDQPVTWAVALPEPVEPRSNSAVAAFMNTFLRGNRDTQPRSQSGSILQQLSLMNDNFVLSRVKVAASPSLAAIAKLPNEEAVEALFLSFLSRRPSDTERARALALLTGASNHNAAIEDLAWAAVNKLEFIYSY